MRNECNTQTGVIVEDGNTYDICVSPAVPLLDESKEKSGWYKQIVSKVDAINGNVRLYPKEVYAKALAKLKKQGFPNAGEHPHPLSYKGADGKYRYKVSIPNAAVKFRDAYIDNEGNVWGEYKTLATDMGRQVQEFIDNKLPIGFSNRMSGNTVRARLNDCIVEVAREIELFTWDVVLNPAEKDSLSLPLPLTDEVLKEIDNNEEEDEKKMNFFSMSLEELAAWKAENKASEEVSICDQVIALKEAEKTAREAEQEAKEAEAQASKKIKALNDVLQEKKQAEETAKLEQEAQKVLYDEVEKLPYDETVKRTILDNGKGILKKEDVSTYVEGQKAMIDSITIGTKMKTLGIPQSGSEQVRASVITSADNHMLFPLVDEIMAEMDRELQKKDPNFKIDKELRKANKALIDNTIQQMAREHNTEYAEFMKAIQNSTRALQDDTAPAISTTGEFAQSAALSLAIMQQAWQDVKFLQLCMTESFSGTTYKMPVEFQSHDLYNEDDFTVGELEGIPTESIQTFLLEFGAKWLKRGFVVTKEAEKELKTGPMRYDIIARNAASIANRFTRMIDRDISTEMIARADEYGAKRVTEESVAADEVEEVSAGVNAPEGTNAKFKVKLLCGNTTPLSNTAVVPPVVRPRVSVWLDQKGRKQQELINEIIVKDKSNTVLTAGRWIASTGKIADVGGKVAQYAVDYENAVIYFVDGVVSKTELPKVQYSYATNIAFFNLAVPDAFKDFPARYYNKLLEMVDIQKAYMGSAPRYVAPDFLLGSLNAMVPFKQAELFYQRALPDGTSLLGGEMYFGRRNGIDLAEHNDPWVAGDSRLLLGKRNAVRVGMGSPYDLEGPFPHLEAGTGKYTSAKEYFATQQIAINTPLVIDEKGMQYHPPFRSIKYYTAAH